MFFFSGSLYWKQRPHLEGDLYVTFVIQDAVKLTSFAVPVHNYFYWYTLEYISKSTSIF